MALSPKQIADIIQTEDNIARIGRETERYEIYHGKLRTYIKKAIEREFILQETVKQLINRIIPINITQKIVNSLAKVYMTPPSRSPVNELNKDQESVDLLTKTLEIDTMGKDANRYFKLSKHFCYESFVHEGKPKMRVLAAHTYTPISDDPIDPANATYIVKHLKWHTSKEKQVHIVWSDTEHYLMDGMGRPIVNPENPEGKNPYEINPLIYIRSQKDALIPVEDDDLIYMQIAICLLLTDLAFATKYQAWSLIWVANMKAQNISFNPNSVIFLPENKGGQEPKIGTISPTLQTESMLRQVETLVGMLLSTKNLKSNSMSALTVQSVQSGISKALDSAESTEDKADQQAYFIEAEKQLFEVLKKQLPVWRSAGLLNPDYVGVSLSDDFELAVRFATPKPLQSEKETVEVENLKIESGFTTHDRAIAVVNPDLTAEQIEELKAQIAKDQKLKAQAKPAENPEDKTDEGDDGQAADDSN